MPRPPRTVRRSLVATLAVALCLAPGAPVAAAPDGADSGTARTAGAGTSSPDSSFVGGVRPGPTATGDSGAVDSFDRASVIDAYRHRWLPATETPFGWVGGSVETCQAGTPTAAAAAAELAAANYVRDQAGLGPLSENLSHSAAAQQAALIMDANDQLSHWPPSSWRCWSADGATAAAGSNLLLDPSGVPFAGRGVELFMSDDGATNATVGHRSLLLNGQVVRVGLGMTPQARSIYGLTPGADLDQDTYGPRASAWPTQGSFPAPMLPASGRWSFETYYSTQIDRDLSAAHVEVDRIVAGTPIPVDVDVEFRDASLLVFRPATVTTPAQAGDDVTYRITFSGVRSASGTAAPDITYTTTLVPGTATHTWTTRPSVHGGVDGSPMVGDPVTVDPGTLEPAVAADHLTYTWYRDGSRVGTGSSYVPTWTDLGERLTVEVAARTATGGTANSTLVHTAPVGYDEAPTSTAAPTISGTPVPGGTLSSSSGSWSPTPVDLRYQWLRDGDPISGATGTNYTVTDADAGHTLAAAVTGYSTTGRAATATSAPVPVDEDEAEPVESPRVIQWPEVSGTTRVGKALTATTGTWSGATSYTVQWRRDGAPIPDATGTRHLLQPDDLGSRISVAVTATGPTGLSATETSAPTPTVAAGAAVKPSGKVRLVGKARPGRRLAARIPSFTPAADRIKVTWLRGSHPIRGAHGVGYRVRRGDVGSWLRVQVTARREGHLDRVVRSARVRVRRR